MATEGASRRSRVCGTWSAVRRYALPTLLLAAVAYAAWRAWPMIVPAAHVVVTVDVALFVAAAVAETMSYLVLATVLRRLAHDARLSYADAVQAGLVAVGLGRTLPAAPVEGMVLTARQLADRGMDRRRTVVAVGLAQWYFARAVFAIGAVAFVIVGVFAALHARLAQDRLWFFGASALLVVAFGLMGWLTVRGHLVERLGRATRRVPILRHQADRIAASARAWRQEIEAAVGDRTRRLTLLTIAMIASLADALCFILCFRAVQVHTSVDVLLVAYAIGMLGALLPLLPGGIGVMEAAIPAFLFHVHVPVVRALAGVLAYRMLATVAPAIVGAGILANFHIIALRRRIDGRRAPRR